MQHCDHEGQLPKLSILLKNRSSCPLVCLHGLFRLTCLERATIFQASRLRALSSYFPLGLSSVRALMDLVQSEPFMSMNIFVEL